MLRAYVETSVFSYLAARPSKSVIKSAHQQITKSWWATRASYSFFVSEFVVGEAERGDPSAAARRLRFIAGIPLLEISEDARALARAVLSESAMPTAAALDAAHVAVSAAHGMDLLVTWNCTHIANASLRKRIESVCRDLGFEPPTICTPEELCALEVP